MAHGYLLVVEDDDNVRGLLVEYFREHSEVEVDSARDGAEALHALSRHHYVVIVLDLMMPHMSGIDFLDSLQALTSDPSLKTLDHAPAVVVITSAPPDAMPSCDIEHRFPSVVHAVMRKPLDVGALARCVESLL